MKLLNIIADDKKSKPIISFGGFFNDGRIIIYIDGVRYEYITPSFYHNKIKRIATYSPLKALNLVKKFSDK